MCGPNKFMHWTRHMATVPKGFLRYQVLKLLAEKPLSGKEIMDKIQEQTEGRWTPSPGSIYPLLALLEDYGYIQQLPKDETGRKPYQITEEGRKFLQEQEKQREEYNQTSLGLFTPFIFNHTCPQIDTQQAQQIRENMRKIFQTLFTLRQHLTQKPTNQKIQKIIEILQKITETLQKETEKLKEE
ncbi:MAG: PadR family transcriptional regulator [Candidatus Odinarchaeum yellowstonii]|uniref:PadR family transcriptional regulator n=1 Tax=Odinarchaeota yellowstonii (strain LCB_4) TaxID=1841599 RepID=A0AAF0D1Z2_ODILC|nr:MAG: PadR family transcriptional regulator [Candidatus Odinarchaeum yellowstonii]